jgi:hypothetical protein
MREYFLTSRNRNCEEYRMTACDTVYSDRSIRVFREESQVKQEVGFFIFRP